MSRNFVKGGYVVVSPTKSVTIDSNEIIKRKLEELRNAQLIKEDALLCGDENPSEDADGFVEGLDPIQVEALVSDEPEIPQISTEEINAEAERIIAEAEAQAEAIRNNAKEEGYNRGFEEGRAAASAQIEKEKEKLRAEFDVKKKDLEEQFDRELSGMEPMLIGKLTEIYEHILGVSLSDSTSIVLFLLKRSLGTMDSNKDYVIHVSKDDYDYINENIPAISKASGILPERLEIVEDHSLLKNGCMIETDGGIFDVGLDTQLTMLRKQLMILSMEN